MSGAQKRRKNASKQRKRKEKLPAGGGEKSGVA